jgi:hypothetical protein
MRGVDQDRVFCCKGLIRHRKRVCRADRTIFVFTPQGPLPFEQIVINTMASQR